MKMYCIILSFILVVFVCPNVFGQKCKEKFPDVVVLTNHGIPKIIRKPEPKYTEEARRHEIQGTVLLRAVFHSSGKIQNVCWVRNLPHGLTKNSIKAAYQIVFEPVTEAGQPVSVTRYIEYNFNLY